MRYLLIIPAFLLLASCGNKKAEEEIVKLNTPKDQLSYCIGAEQAKELMGSLGPNKSRFKFDILTEGFEKGLNLDRKDIRECETTLNKLMGVQGQDFDTTYLDAGSLCLGKMAGSFFHERWNKLGGYDKIDIKMAIIGFKHSLLKKDTLVKSDLRIKMLNEFIFDLNRMNGAKMFEKARKLPNIEILPCGVIIQTLKAGSGPSPTLDDEVKVDYVLTGALGDTIESSRIQSIKSGAPIPILGLNAIIEGWKESFPHLQKGGQYQLFIPSELAYGERHGHESLCFYIHFYDFGKIGTLAKALPKQAQTQGH